MRLGRLKRDLHWNWGIAFETPWDRYSKIIKIFQVWFFKLKSLPEQGLILNEMNYRGFYYRKEVFTNLEIVVYTKTVHFRLPYWVRIYRRKDNG